MDFPGFLETLLSEGDLSSFPDQGQEDFKALKWNTGQTW